MRKEKTHVEMKEPIQQEKHWRYAEMTKTDNFKSALRIIQIPFLF